MKETKEEGRERGKALFRSSLGSFSAVALRQSRWQRCSICERSSVGAIPSFCEVPPPPPPPFRGGGGGGQPHGEGGCRTMSYFVSRPA